MMIRIPIIPVGRHGRCRTMLRALQKVTFSRFMKNDATLRLCVELTGSRRMGQKMYYDITKERLRPFGTGE